jgi:serine/threonine protein kinase
MRPELAEELTLDIHSAEVQREGEIIIPFNYDARKVCLWKFAVSVFGMLHGYWPWDNPPESGVHDSLMAYRGGVDARVFNRRRRMIHEPLPIADHLSDDCKDLLRLMFSKKPEDRPLISRLRGHPWFQKWKYDTRPLVRPHSDDFTAYIVMGPPPPHFTPIAASSS